MAMSVKTLVARLEKAYGVAEWWPRESSFEVAIGAILTQRTSWTNVQLAISNLKAAGTLTPDGIAACDGAVLQGLLRPSGFYRQKTRYVQVFSRHLLDRYGGRMGMMAERPPPELREELLALDGIGQETSDTIMLYALGLPSFVVDSYSFRLLDRLGLYSGRDYGHVKRMFERALGPDTARLASAHAAIVTHCKEHCRVRPRCAGCPLRRQCPSETHDED